MAIDCKDYYKTLGLSRGASDEELRNAFRRLARMFHPDKTGNNPEAETQFKEINEAYEVLGDPEKRQRYDEFIGAWESNGWGPESFQDFTRAEGRPDFARTGGHEHYRFDGAGFSDFFEQMFGRRGGGKARRSEREEPRDESSGRERARNAADLRGDDLESDIWVTLEEVTKGGVRTITMNRAVKCPTCLGMGQYNAHPCKQCEGKGSLLQTDTYKVKVPKGVKDGAFLRVPGRGEQGIAQSPPGDLYLKVRYTLHPEFRMEQGTLVHDLEVAPWEAVLGATVTVPTLDGKATIKVPPGTQNGRKLRLKGRGVPSADGNAGDLILMIKVQVPNTARSRERELWQELAKESQFVPRGN
jgi:curved DNA-binding protein